MLVARLVQWLRRYYEHLLVPEKVLKGEAKSYTNQPYCYGSLGFSDIVRLWDTKGYDRLRP